MKERYVFIFDYDGGWMIILYENGTNIKYFNSAENGWDNSIDYANMFIENGGERYYYKLPSYDYVEDIDVFKLENHPIDSFENYLLK